MNQVQIGIVAFHKQNQFNCNCHPYWLITFSVNLKFQRLLRWTLTGFCQKKYWKVDGAIMKEKDKHTFIYSSSLIHAHRFSQQELLEKSFLYSKIKFHIEHILLPSLLTVNAHI